MTAPYQELLDLSQCLKREKLFVESEKAQIQDLNIKVRTKDACFVKSAGTAFRSSSVIVKCHMAIHVAPFTKFFFGVFDRMSIMKDHSYTHCIQHFVIIDYRYSLCVWCHTARPFVAYTTCVHAVSFRAVTGGHLLWCSMLPLRPPTGLLWRVCR